MELVEGSTLADRIAQGPIPLDDTASIAKQIAEALTTPAMMTGVGVLLGTAAYMSPEQSKERATNNIVAPH